MAKQDLSDFAELVEALTERFTTTEYDEHGSAVSIETACKGLIAEQFGDDGALSKHHLYHLMREALLVLETSYDSEELAQALLAPALVMAVKAIMTPQTVREIFLERYSRPRDTWHPNTTAF